MQGMGKIQEIYRQFIQDTDYMMDASKKVEREINKLLKDVSQKDGRQYEQYRDMLFGAATVAEEAGFEKGFRFAAELMAECIAGRDISAEL